MTYRFLAFDCGATSARGILATLSSTTFTMEEVYRFPSAIKKEDGHIYWDVDAMYGHLVACLKQLGLQGVKLDSIGIDTWGVDFGCVDAAGKLLALPRCYRDSYTDGIPEKVYATVPREELYARTGIQTLQINSIFQLYAQKDALDGADTLLFMPDLLSCMLTGKKVCEYTEASTSGMLNAQTHQFDKELLERLGIPTDILLPVVQPGTQVGTLLPELAASTGLGEVPVIAVAGHDTASAIAAVPASGEHFAYLSSGTWSLMGIELPSSVVNAESSRLDFTNEGGVDGTTCFLKNLTGMWLLEQCRAVWKAAGRDYSYTHLVEMARAEADFEGRINTDDPRFASPSNMLEEIKAALGFDASDAQVVSCIYHSLAERYAQILEQLCGFSPFEIDRLHIIGGGSANELLNQWTANALGIPVVAGPVEATAIGNVLIQARAAGLVKDRLEMRKLVSRYFDVKVFNPNE